MHPLARPLAGQRVARTCMHCDPIRLIGTLLVFSSVASVASCQGTATGRDTMTNSTPSGNEAGAMSAGAQDSLALELVVPDEIHPGSSITFTLRARNQASRRLDLYLRGREPTLDVMVTTASGDTVWHRLAGEIIPAIVNVRSLAAGEVLELVATWDQRTTSGTALAPGEYVARGLLLAEQGALETPEVRFRVGPG